MGKKIFITLGSQKLEIALDTVRGTKYNSYESNTINIITSIEDYIEGNCL